MWLLEFLFFSTTLLVGWTLFGYFIFIWFVGLFRDKRPAAIPEHWPFITVIVPCLNESALALEKLANLRNSAYPRDRMEIIFADGGSTDGGAEMLTAAILPDEPFRVERCPAPGKINQLNHVLPMAKGEIIVNTDADARLTENTLQNIVSEICADSQVWVAGAYCRPVNTLEFEKMYWDAQNKGRFLETKAMSSSIVTAPCYAFRRELISSFPDDTVADDVYIAMLASAKGKRVVQSSSAHVEELRGPSSVAEFMPHKFRKSNAFLRESLRFVYRLPDMPHLIRLMLATRIGQQVALPWLLILWALLAGTLITMGRLDIPVIGTIFLFVMAWLTFMVFRSVKLPNGSNRYSAWTKISGNFLTLTILMATGVSYPWFRQTSSYARVNSSDKSK